MVIIIITYLYWLSKVWILLECFNKLPRNDVEYVDFLILQKKIYIYSHDDDNSNNNVYKGLVYPHTSPQMCHGQTEQALDPVVYTIWNKNNELILYFSKPFIYFLHVCPPDGQMNNPVVWDMEDALGTQLMIV